MKIIKKEAKFGCNEHQKFYHESFDNYKEFYNVLMQRQNGLSYGKTIESIFNKYNEDWLGVKSIEEAKDLFLNGWQQNVDKLKKEFEKDLKLINYEKVNKQFNNVEGFMPIVANALIGLPNSMISFKKDQKKSKILKFIIQISRSGAYDADYIIEKMSKIFTYIAAIEKSGKYRSRIEVAWVAYGDNANKNRTNASMSVLVKSENQLFDIKRLCFPIVHPAMQRLFAFSWFESLPNCESMRESGYGCGFAGWQSSYKIDYENMIKENNEKVICLDLKSDIEAVMEQEVK